MIYLGIFILIAALAHLVLLLVQRVQRTRSYEQLIASERQILEKRASDLLVDANPVSNSKNIAWAGWRKFRLDKVVAENSSIKSFYFLAHDGKELPEYLPGQHLTFRLKVSGESKPVIRCYTLSDSCEKGVYRVSVKRQAAPKEMADAPKGIASCYLHDSLDVGDVVDVKAPAGKFYLDETEKTPIVMIAGGIGVTPSLAMLNALASSGSPRTVILLYAVQNEKEKIMTALFDSLEKAIRHLTIYCFYTEPPGKALSANERHGYINISAMSDLGIPWDADFYVCGPPPMMKAIVPDLEKQGVDSSRIHFESFGPASVSKRRVADSTISTQEGIESESHSITFTMSDVQLEWTESQGSILDAAESMGVNIESGCRAGSCGTCLTAISEGQVSYIDEPGTEIEKGSCLACIAIPAGNLKLNA